MASRNKEKAEAFAQEHGIPVALESYQNLLDDKNIDAIYISLPNALHAEWTIRAAEAGADIVRVHDVKEMVRVARMSDAIVRGWKQR